MITRKLGQILRGKATPFQLVAACVLGAMIGFAPGFLQAPALWILLIGSLLIVNANLAVAALMGAATGLLSLALAPVSFRVGQFVLDGPSSGLARTVVNSRVLAWCGLEYYGVTGGQVLGIALGAVVGVVLAFSVTSFRRRMLAAHDQPSKWKALAEKPGAKFAIWLFFGAPGKGTWEQKLGKRVGNPVRVWGVLLVAVTLIGGWLSHRLLLQPLARDGLKLGLEEVNGATVDVGPVELDLGAGRFSVTNLALADPKDLTHDLLTAATLSADIDEADLLRRRVHVASVVIKDARSGSLREKKGERVAPRLGQKDPQEEEPSVPFNPDDWTLEQVVEKYELWQGRLSQARRWINRLSGDPGAKGTEDKESLSERLAREVREKGWLDVAAGHLIVDRPTFLLSELVIDGLVPEWMPGRVFDVRGSVLSTHPHLMDAPPQLQIASRDGAIGFAVDLAPASKAGGPGALRFHWKGLAVDEVLSQLSLGSKAPFSGGTLDLEIDGKWLDGKIGEIDLPLRVTLRGTTFAMGGIQPTQLDQLVLPIGLTGPIDAPRIRFNGKSFADALTAAGKSQLAQQVRAQLEGKLDAEREKLEGKLDEERDKLEGEAKKKLEELGEKAGVGELLDKAKKDPASLLEEAKKKPGGLLDGVLGGKKKKDPAPKTDGL